MNDRKILINSEYRDRLEEMENHIFLPLLNECLDFYLTHSGQSFDQIYRKSHIRRLCRRLVSKREGSIVLVLDIWKNIGIAEAILLRTAIRWHAYYLEKNCQADMKRMVPTETVEIFLESLGMLADTVPRGLGSLVVADSSLLLLR